MVTVNREITKEQYEQAKEKGIESILPDYVLLGYGYYGGELKEESGKYYVRYNRGDSCD